MRIKSVIKNTYYNKYFMELTVLILQEICNLCFLKCTNKHVKLDN